MNKEQLLNEIRETNLAYLLLAQQMIRLDKATGMFRLGVSDDVAMILEQRYPSVRFHRWTARKSCVWMLRINSGYPVR